MLYGLRLGAVLAALTCGVAVAAPPAEVVWRTAEGRSPAGLFVAGDRAYVDHGAVTEVHDAATGRLLRTLYEPVVGAAGSTVLRVRGKELSGHAGGTAKATWSLRLPGTLYAPLIAVGGQVLAATSKGGGGDAPPESYLTLLDPATGKRAWEIATGRWSAYRPVVLGRAGLVVAGCQAFGVKDGREAWESDVCNERPMALPREDAGVVEVWDGDVAATLELSSGKESARRLTLPDKVITPPVLMAGVLAAGARSGTFALDAATRQVRWRTPASGLTHGPTPAGGLLWVVSDAGAQALDPATGAERCRHPVLVDPRSELWAAGDVVLLRTLAAKAAVAALRCPASR